MQVDPGYHTIIYMHFPIVFNAEYFYRTHINIHSILDLRLNY